MKQILCYTDGTSVYAHDDTTSFFIGACPGNPQELEIPLDEQRETSLEVTQVVELTKAGLSIDDIAKLRREGIL